MMGSLGHSFVRTPPPLPPPPWLPWLMTSPARERGREGEWERESEGERERERERERAEGRVGERESLYFPTAVELCVLYMEKRESAL